MKKEIKISEEEIEVMLNSMSESAKDRLLRTIFGEYYLEEDKKS